MAVTRGNAISAYSPPFARGAKVYGANIQSGVVTSAHLADGTVVAGEIGAGAVTSAKIGTGAVVAAKLGAQAVASAKIKAAWLSGTIVSGMKVFPIAHGLGVKPKSVVGVALLTKTQLEASSARCRVIVVAAASAAGTASAFIAGTQPANESMKYALYIQA